MLVGPVVVGVVFWALWKWHNAWVARVVWFIAALRVPTLIGGTFLPTPDQLLAPAFYGTALARAKRIGLDHVALSLSHSREFAVASVVGESEHGNLVPRGA